MKNNSKKGFIVYYDILEQLEDMTDEQVGKIFRAMLKYEKFDEIPNFDGELKVAFKFIKTILDIEREKYKEKCAKNKAAIEKRWNEENTDEYECIQTNTNDTDIDTNKQKEKEIKNKYGEHNNILLTINEYNKLLEIDNGLQAIEYLSNYIVMKGYKAKSHYLAIKKWVFNALKEDKIKSDKLAYYESKQQPTTERGTKIDEGRWKI